MKPYNEKVVGAFIGAFCGIAGTLLGGWDMPLKILVVFIIFDFITGFLAGMKQKNINSEVMFWGGVRKMIIAIAVIIGNCCDVLAQNPAPIIRTLVLYYFIAREGISLIENCGLLGVTMPKAITKFLREFNKEA